MKKTIDTDPWPDGYRIRRWEIDHEVWYLPEKYHPERKWWETFVISRPRSGDGYHRYKTYGGAKRFLMRRLGML